MIRHAVTLALVLLAACQPLPHPFAEAKEDPGSPILTLPGTVGIVVEPPAGLAPEEAARVAGAMAEAIREAGIPANTAAGNRRSYHLTGAKAAGGIAWELKGADGQSVGTVTGGPETAGKIAALIEEPVLVEHHTKRILALNPVKGAPGDGAAALRRAFEFLFKRKGMELTTEGETKGAIVIAGTVAVGPAKAPGLQHVSIVWTVHRPDGGEAGTVKQENDVPKGTLDGAWGDIGMAVASAAIDDIVRVLGTIPENG